MRPLAFVLAAIVSLGLAILSAGQSTQQIQKFRASTRLVEVSVVVQDGRRRPVEGLARDDFQIFEEGREQPIAFFSAHSRRVSEGAETAATGEERVSDGTFTNRIPSPAANGVVVILFDQLNSGALTQERMRAQLLRYLSKVRPGDRVALYVLTAEGLRVLYDFTTDARMLVSALQRVQAGESAMLTAAQERISESLLTDLSAFARGNFANAQGHLNRLRSETTLDALEAVAAHLKGIPGRKNVVWLSSGFPLRIAQAGPAGAAASVMSEEVRRATRSLNTTDAAVYPVDARGLIPTPPPKARAEQSMLGTIMRPLEGVMTVADWTGGRTIYNTNDLAGAIDAAVQDSRITYSLGYYPSNEAWDGRFRRIEVKVRRRGVEVRHRAGYFALPPAPPPDPAARQTALTTALNSPLEATAIPLAVRRMRHDGDAIELGIELSAGTPMLENRNGRWAGAVDVVVAQTLASGERIRDMESTLPFSVTDQDRDRMLRQGVRLTRTIRLRSSAVDVRVVVRDAATGLAGSVFIPAAVLSVK